MQAKVLASVAVPTRQVKVLVIIHLKTTWYIHDYVRTVQFKHNNIITSAKRVPPEQI